jgi:CRISPR-associated endonuclease Cas1
MRDLTTESPASLCFDPALPLLPGTLRLFLQRREKATSETTDSDKEISTDNHLEIADHQTFAGLIVCPRWIQPTYDAIAECTEHGHDLACLRGNRVSALIHAQNRVTNTALRQRQFRRHADEAACMELANSLVWAKTAGQLALLRRAAHRRSDAELDQRADRLARDRLTIPGAKTIEALRGSEGIIARTYFGGWPRILELPSFQRIPRRALNPINHLLDLCYSRLCLAVTLALIDAGVDVALGTLHAEDDRRPTLALDLMEPLRSLIADRFVFNVYRDALNGDWLHHEGNRWSLTSSGRRRWMKRWNTWYFGGRRRAGQKHAVDETIAIYLAWIDGKGDLRWPTSER